MLISISANAVAIGSAAYGEGQGSILLDEVNCNGTETRLEQCAHNGYYNHDCRHSEDVSVLCSAGKGPFDFIFSIYIEVCALAINVGHIRTDLNTNKAKDRKRRTS